MGAPPCAQLFRNPRWCSRAAPKVGVYQNARCPNVSREAHSFFPRPLFEKVMASNRKAGFLRKVRSPVSLSRHGGYEFGRNYLQTR